MRRGEATLRRTKHCRACGSETEAPVTLEAKDEHGIVIYRATLCADCVQTLAEHLDESNG